MNTIDGPSAGKITEAIHGALVETYLSKGRHFIKAIGGGIHLIRSEAWSERDSHGLRLLLDSPTGVFEYRITAQRVSNT